MLSKYKTRHFKKNIVKSHPTNSEHLWRKLHGRMSPKCEAIHLKKDVVKSLMTVVHFMETIWNMLLSEEICNFCSGLGSCCQMDPWNCAFGVKDTKKQRLCCSVNTFDDNLMITGSLVVITEPARLTKVVLESGSKFNTNKQKVGIGFNRSVTSIHASWPVLSIPWFVEKLQLLSTPTIACLLHWGTIYYGGGWRVVGEMVSEASSLMLLGIMGTLPVSPCLWAIINGR